MKRTLLVGLFVVSAAMAQEGPDEDVVDVPAAAEAEARVVTPDPVGPGRGPPASVREAWRSSRDLPLAARLEAVTRPLVGADYELDALGEGQLPDADPAVRYDAFDCLTFVEEGLALALAGAPEHAALHRMTLRYGASPYDYADRHHFMELQWLPAAVTAGYLRDATADHPGAIEVSKQVDPELWRAWPPRRRFQMPDGRLPVGTMRLTMLPLEAAIQAAPSFPPGSVVAIVRADRPTTPLWISHVGIVLEGEPRRMRHASRMNGGRVTEHELAAYLRRQLRPQSWAVVGVAVYEPRDAGPRLARLPADHALRAATTPR